MSSIYQIKVTLINSKPTIWRRILIADTTTLLQLHDILQIIMGWADYHLHMFTINGQIYGDPEGDEFEDMGTKNESCFKLNQLIGSEGFKFRYEYDFGDSWLHDLVVCWLNNARNSLLKLDERSRVSHLLKTGDQPCVVASPKNSS